MNNSESIFPFTFLVGVRFCIQAKFNQLTEKLIYSTTEEYDTSLWHDAKTKGKLENEMELNAKHEEIEI